MWQSVGLMPVTNLSAMAQNPPNRFLFRIKPYFTSGVTLRQPERLKSPDGLKSPATTRRGDRQKGHVLQRVHFKGKQAPDLLRSQEKWVFSGAKHGYLDPQNGS